MTGRSRAVGGVGCAGAAGLLLLAMLMAVAVASASGEADEEETHNVAAAPQPPGKVAPGTVPEAYQDLVERWGTACATLSPAILAAQLQQESGWNPQASSPAGAQGIAQFMPGTWAAHGLDANGDGRADVWNPEDAIPSAAKYDCSLAGYVKNVPGDPVTNMLAAYNAGPDAVKRHSGVPPYRETEQYVKVIRQAAASFTAPADSSTAEAVLPVASFELTAGYGQPGSRWQHNHTGQDFAAPSGTPVRAVSSATVTSAGWAGAYGYRIILRLPDGTELWYGHLSAMNRTSGTVTTGETIGRVGTTGNSTGPHLHLEVRPAGGDPIDPLPWLRSRGLAI